MKINFKHVESRLASMIGEPTLFCWDKDNEIVVQICAVPMLGMDATDANALCYPVLVLSAKGLATATVASCVEDALNSFDMAALDDNLVAQPGNSLEFRVFVDVHPCECKDQHIYHAVACVSVKASHIERIRLLIDKQTQALKRIAADPSDITKYSH